MRVLRPNVPVLPFPQTQSAEPEADPESEIAGDTESESVQEPPEDQQLEAILQT